MNNSEKDNKNEQYYIQEILTTALKYQELGWSVIPLAPGTKFPPKGETWMNRRYFSADECPDEQWKKDHPGVSWGRATPEEIRQWWKDHPTANVGMVTGAISEVDSVDLDGRLAQDILEAETGEELPGSIPYTTGRPDGGKQILYKYHGGGLKSKAGYVFDGNGNSVDLRTDGGITVLPPSVHKSGKRYEWNDIDPTEMGLDDLEDFPPEVFSLMAKQCVPDAGKGENKNRVDPEKWFREGIPQGRKHHDLFRYACKCISRGMAYDETIILTTELARRCNPRPKDGPGHAAMVRVKEAFRKYGKKETPNANKRPRSTVTFI